MPVARIQLPDGRIGRFEVPEGTTPEQVVAFAQQNLPQQPAQPQSLASKVVRGGNALGQGLTDSVAETIGSIPDLAMAGARTIGLPTSSDPHYYTHLLKRGIQGAENLLSAPFRGVTPDTGGPQTKTERALYAAGHGAGDAASVFVPAAALSKVARAESLPGMIANALKAQPIAQTVAGATAGGVGDATGNPYLGLAASLLVPGVAGLGKKALADSLGKRATIKAAPDTKALKEQGSTLFDQALQNKAAVSSQAYNNFLSDMGRQLADDGVDPMLHPKVTAVFSVLSKKAGSEPTLRDLQIMRRQIGTAATSAEPDERRIASIMQDKLDDFVETLHPGDMASGSMGSSVANIKQARKLWGRMRRSELIDTAIDKAENQASGLENGLRIQIRQILNNPKKMRGFSADEKAAMQALVRGGPLQNFLKKVSKLSPGRGQQTNMLGATAGAGLGGTLGGLPGAIIVPTVGYAAQKALEASQRNAVDYARALTALGEKAPPGRLAKLLGPSHTPGLLASTLLGQAKTPVLDKLLGTPQSSGSLPQK